MTGGLRKLGLMLHVTASVSWLGAVLGFLSLTVAALWSSQPFMIRAAYVSMDVLARFAILPLCVASLVTGVVQSLISPWGLVQHYWVAFKLLLNALSTIVLVGHMRPIAGLAQAALDRSLAGGAFSQVRIQIAVDACAAAIVLLIATALAIYKPRGVTRYGWQKQQERRVNRLTQL
ncbi:MAG TPA: hypothetical protein VFU02_00280 [Polyangiaceae bacterium]|nr:hypothetical protein [Polyangiaceae bacterium]